MVRICEEDIDEEIAKEYAGIRVDRVKNVRTSITQMEAKYSLYNEGKRPQIKRLRRQNDVDANDKLIEKGRRKINTSIMFGLELSKVGT